MKTFKIINQNTKYASNTGKLFENNANRIDLLQKLNTT